MIVEEACRDFAVSTIRATAAGSTPACSRHSDAQRLPPHLSWHFDRKEGIGMKLATTLLVVFLSGAGFVTGGEIVSDGDLDDLIVGSAPDCDDEAGAWGWPQEYLENTL